MDYPRLLIEWRRFNNLKEPDLMISRSRLKYIRFAEEWIKLHKEGYSRISIAKMYRVAVLSVVGVFNEAGYDYSRKKDKSPYHLAAPIWNAHMRQGLTIPQISNIFKVKESIVNSNVIRLM